MAVGALVTYPHPATQNITFITRAKTGRDSDGNATRGSATKTVPGLYAPGSTSESNDDQQRTVTVDTIIVPNPPTDLVVHATDEVQVPSLPGVTFEVDGDPKLWAPGLQVVLKRVSG